MTDKMASYGIEEYMLRLRQYNEYRKTLHLVVLTDDPEKFLSDEPENDGIGRLCSEAYDHEPGQYRAAAACHAHGCP